MRGPAAARVAAVLVTVIATLAMATVAWAATPGSGGWYWPTGTEDFGGMGPWWQSRGGDTRHLAQDMAAACGKPVYAIGAGTVLESRYIGGYGPGGTQGGAVVILHTTAEGREFKALYGHLKGLKYAVGDSVAAGAVIGYVNGSSPNHLHFGIHPGRVYPWDGNVFRGHTYDSDETYGWTDPVAYLRANPRVIPYVAPVPPVVLSLTTTATPMGAVAAGRAVWWQEVSEDTTTTWRFDLATRRLELVSEPATLPAGDPERYCVSVSARRPGIAVREVRTGVSARAAHTTPLPGVPATIVGSVRNAAGAVFQGARLVIERWSGNAWERAGWAVTRSDGTYRAETLVRSTSQLRVRFCPPATYASGASTTMTVAPHVALSRPALSVATPRRAQAFRLTSVLGPRHPSTAVVEFQLEQKVAGQWRRVSARRAVLTDSPNGTACTAAVSCPASGEWRARAFAPADSGHAATSTQWRAFTVQ